MQLIEKYYWEGYPYKSILRILHEYDGIEMTMRTLLRRLKDLGLARRCQPGPMLDVWNAIKSELQGPGIWIFMQSHSYAIAI